MTGGAGEGMAKARQAKPMANASARPRRSFIAVIERGGVPVLQDVAGNNKAECHRHQHERADQAGRCGRGYVEIPATRADQETDDQSNERGSHGDRSLEGETTAAERCPKSARVVGSNGDACDSSMCMPMRSTPGVSHGRGGVPVATIGADRRPLRHGGRQWRSQIQTMDLMSSSGREK